MKIDQIGFVCSSPTLAQCPKEELPEFAFIGRSNVGKSSLINMLAGQKGLAKVSGTPGKTKLINHFRVESAVGGRQSDDIRHRASGIGHPPSAIRHPSSFSWFLVDLPGYGFARLSKSEREKFEGIIKNYLNKRENLAATFLLVDIRHEPQQIDLDFMNWMGDHDLAFIVLFTKSDKLSKSQLSAHIDAYKKIMKASWNELPLMIPTSALTREGREDVLDAIGIMLQEITG